MRDLKILTWHVHGAYLYYLSHVPQTFYLPVKPDRPEGYGGRAGNKHWPENLIEVPAEEVHKLSLDMVVFQSRKNYLEDQFEILSSSQRRLPRIYIEHDPPREHPTDTRHPVDDSGVLLVHVTHFNELMWDSGRTPHKVIEHGVVVPPHLQYSGELDRGIAVVNGLKKRGRRLGLDVYERVKLEVPLDLVGMGSELVGGLGEFSHNSLADFERKYRFFFNPIRYTSLGLAVCEAMMLGMPVIGLATTEMVNVIRSGVNGFVSTDVSLVVDAMRNLLSDRLLALSWGEKARQDSLERFGIDRFVHDWNETFLEAIS